MVVTFYKNMSDKRFVTKQLSEISATEIIFLEDNNIVSPYIIVNMIENYNDINYCYVGTLGRYYYVSGFTVLVGNQLRIDLKCDVLMSFADDIKTSAALVVRSNSVGNIMMKDPNQPTRSDEILTNLAFSGCEFLRGIGTTNYSFLLNTFGGVNSGNQ